MKNIVGGAARQVAYATGFLASALLAACGGGGGGPQPQGTLSLAMTDAPSCYKEVWVTVEKVRVHKGSGTVADGQTGWEEIVPASGPVRVNLLNLTNGDLAALGEGLVDAGTYHNLRLVLSGAAGANEVVLLDNSRHELKTPSAQQSGLKIKTSFTVAENSTTEMVLDFDACKSVVKAGASGQYILKPVVRLGEKVAGSIEGTLDTSLDESKTSVTAYLNGEAVRATVPDATTGQFKLAYLMPGTYTVVITSQDHATAVVLDVPVGTTPTTLGTSAIALPPSTMHAVSGTVAEGSTPVGDATVTAWQAIASGAILVNSTLVDMELGTYSMVLPVEAPVVAPFATSGLVFAADDTAVGTYTLKAAAPGREVLSQTVDTRTTPTPNPVDFAY